MEGALNNFPSLKTFGGFDPLPDLGREGLFLISPFSKLLSNFYFLFRY